MRSYAQNDPINFNDPRGLAIYLTAHEVKILGVPTGQAHFAIEVIPEDQAYWANSNIPLQQHPNASGVNYFTISGDAKGLPPGYELSLDFNKPSDKLSSNFLVGTITRPAGVSENEYIQDLIDATQMYNVNRVDYDILPELLPGGGANSTGAAFGLVQATGGTLPDTSALQGGLGTAGSGTLVPPLNFGTGGTEGGLLPYPNQSNLDLLEGVYAK